MKKTKIKSMKNEGYKKSWLVNVFNFYGEFEYGTEIKAFDYTDAKITAAIWMEKNEIRPLHYSDGVYIDYEIELK